MGQLAGQVGTKAEELQREDAQLAKQVKENAGRMTRKASGRGFMAVMGQPSMDEGVSLAASLTLTAGHAIG
jgi:hypothetical protein